MMDNFVASINIDLFAAFNENDHPRGADGTFTDKQQTSSKAKRIIARMMGSRTHDLAGLELTEHQKGRINSVKNEIRYSGESNANKLAMISTILDDTSKGAKQDKRKTRGRRIDDEGYIYYDD